MLTFADITKFLPAMPSLPSLPGAPTLTQLVEVPLTAVVYIWVFWLVYVVVMGFYRAHLAKRLNPLTFVMASPVLIVGYALDMFCQYTLACLVFWDRPKSFLHERMVTTRLQRYVAEGEVGGWRFKVATYICDKMLDPFDPTGNHC